MPVQSQHPRAGVSLNFASWVSYCLSLVLILQNQILLFGRQELNFPNTHIIVISRWEEFEFMGKEIAIFLANAQHSPSPTEKDVTIRAMPFACEIVPVLINPVSTESMCSYHRLGGLKQQKGSASPCWWLPGLLQHPQFLKAPTTPISASTVSWRSLCTHICLLLFSFHITPVILD